jgi:hypothetical protein
VDRDRDVAAGRPNVSFGLEHKIEDAAHHDGYVWVELLKSMLIWNKLEARFPCEEEEVTFVYIESIGLVSATWKKVM